MISKGNHVKFARFVFLPSVKEQKHEFNFFFVQCIIKQLLDSVFVISRIIKVSVRVISLSLRLRLITLVSTLIILDITKASSNNCLLLKTGSLNNAIREFSLVKPSWYMSHYTMIYKNGERMRDFLGLFVLDCSLVFYILGAFLIKQLFHSRLLDMRWL